LALFAIRIYNALVMLRKNVENAWKNIDVVLQQRHDGLSEFIDTCKASMK
jgi:LemA protein